MGSRTARTSRDIRAGHRVTVLREIRSAGAVTRHELAVRAGVSVATASNIVAELSRAGLVREASYEDSGGGRPRARLSVDARHGVLVGVEVRAASVHVDVYDLGLHPRTRWTGSGATRRDVAGAVREALARAGVEPDRVLGIGIAAPAGLRTGQARPAAVRAPVYRDEPAHAATVAELWSRAHTHAETLVSVTLGDGAGAGIALAGTPLRAVTGAAGGWGHTTLVLDGRLCECGRRGCVAAYVGAAGIARHVREAAPGSPLIGAGPEETVRLLAHAMRERDATASAVLARTARYLGAGIAGLVNLIDPDTVALNGWVARTLGRWLLPAARDAATRRRPGVRRPPVRVEASGVRHNAVTAGMAAVALEGLLPALRRGPCGRWRDG